jgi:hypothetical protein
MDTRARLPARDQIFPRDEDEVIGLYANGRSKTRSRVFPASPTVAIRDRADQVAPNLVSNLPTCTGATKHSGLQSGAAALYIAQVSLYVLRILIED